MQRAYLCAQGVGEVQASFVRAGDEMFAQLGDMGQTLHRGQRKRCNVTVSYAHDGVGRDDMLPATTAQNRPTAQQRITLARHPTTLATFHATSKL